MIISITDGVIFRGVNVEVIRFIDGRPMREWASTSEVTPLPDLPRAWNPDGQPVPGEWETYREVGIGETFLREERRWVGEWEEA